MNIELYIDNKIMDIDDSFNVMLSKEFQDPEELIIKDITYSYTISIPTTINNKNVFDFVDVVEVSGKFDRIYEAELYVDNNLVIKGNFIMTEITNDYYSGNLYVPSDEEVKDIFGDKMLNEIIEHNFNISNWQWINLQNRDVANNWNDINNSYRDHKHIIFPFVLYNLPQNEFDANNLQQLEQGGNITLDNTFPAFNVNSVIKDIFKSEGYNVRGNVFSDRRFDEIYQTFSGSAEEYKKNRQSPYYAKIVIDYQMMRNNDISSTLGIFTIPKSDGHKVGADNLMMGTTYRIDEMDNRYGVISPSSTGKPVITVPTSGFYKIKFDGSFNYPQKGGYNKAIADRVRVTGTTNDGDDTTLSNSPIEFQVKKGRPLQDVKYYSHIGIEPSSPTAYNFDESDKTTYLSSKNMYQKFEGETVIPKNNGTHFVNSTSSFNTDDLIIAVRMGGNRFSNYYNKRRTPNRRKEYMATMALPKLVSTNITDDEGGRRAYHVDYNPRNSYDYNKTTALTVVNKNDTKHLTNRQSYYVYNGDSNTFTNINSNETYNGLNNNNVTPSGTTAGSWQTETVVWLEEGENIQIEAVIPFNDYRKKCGILEICQGKLGSYKGRDKVGVTKTNIKFTFEIGMISTDENWKPTATTPIPENLEGFKVTNVNQFLPKIKVNDYINNYLKTFNLTLTKVKNKFYEINYNKKITNSIGNKIVIDDFININDVKFKRLNLPKEYTLKWKTDVNEAGYVYGNDTKVDNRQWFDESEYDGSYSVFNNSNSGNSVIRESLWSYNWMKEINFKSFSFPPQDYSYDVPVITNHKIWDTNEYTPSTALMEGYYTELAPRLFYPRIEDGRMVQISYKNLEDTAWLIMLDNKIELDETIPFRSANENDDKPYYVLDYKKIIDINNNKLKTINMSFFNINIDNNYQIDVPIKLPNHIFNEIKNNTLFQLNDNFYKIKGIEGHDIAEEEDAELNLIKINN